MKLVVVESPYAGDVEANIAYARRCVVDCIQRGEAPYASHLLFTQPDVLDDLLPEEREMGIKAGFVWGAQAPVRVFYVDRGWTSGMKRGLREARRLGQVTELRALDRDLTLKDVLEEMAIYVGAEA